MEEFWKKNKLAIIGFGSIGLFLLFLPWVITQHYWGVSFYETGQIGDTIGGITAPFIGFLAAILVYLAFKAQIDANKAIQNQFKIQQFEDKFYTMLDLHKSNVNEMQIDNSFNQFYYKQRDGSYMYIHSSSDINGSISGRELFGEMIFELNYCLEKVFESYNQDKATITKPELSKFAYTMFFYGIESIFVKDFPLLDDIKSKIIERLSIRRNEFSIALKENNPKLHSPFKKFKYLPFEGHSGKLAHYFRQLYHTVRYVVNEMEKTEPLISSEEGKQFLKILRAQLSNDEQLMLYYNYYCGFGSTWDYLGGKNQFLTKYKMIHNIPMEYFKYVEDPREHFRVFIENMPDEERPLFEWGDRISVSEIINKNI